MTDFWGIGHRTATRLEKLGIHSIYDLAHFNPDILKKEMGVMGLQLGFTLMALMKAMFTSLIRSSRMD